MHTADAARCEYPNSGSMSKERRRSNGGGAVQFLSGGYRKVTTRDLANVFPCRELLDLLRRQPHMTHAAKYSDRCRHSSAVANDLLKLKCSLQVLRIRQTVGNDCRLKRYYSSTIGECLSNFFGDL